MNHPSQPQPPLRPPVPCWAPFVLPLLFLVVGLWLADRHTLFEEWDGAMQAFAAREIGAGLGYTGWASHYWPPLFAVLLLLGSKFTSYFVAGKVISVVSGALLLWVIYRVGHELTGSARVGVVAQALLATNQLFLNTSIQVENHTLAALLFTVAVLAALVAFRRQTWGAFALLGVAVGLAGLARYTNLSLIGALVVLAVLFLRGRKAWLGVSVAAAAFLIVSMPWFVANTCANGSPLATWQHTNIGLSVMPRAFGITRVQWWWDLQSQYHSVGDLLRATPGGYVRNFAHTLLDFARLVLQFLGPLGVLGAAGALLLPWLLPRRVIFPERLGCLTLWLAAAAYLALVCQAFVYGVVLMPFVGFLALTTAVLAQRLTRPRLLPVALGLALLLAANVYFSYGNLTQYLSDRSDGGSMVAAADIGEQTEGDEGIQDKYVMAVNPCRAFYAAWSTGAPSRFLCLPLYFQSDDPVALVTYRGLSDTVKQWAPRYPFQTPAGRADYLIFDEAAKGFLPQYAYLMDPNTKRVPQNWEARCVEPGVVVWRIHW